MDREADRIHQELVRIRDRLHKLEGGQAVVANGVKYLHEWKREVDPVIDKLEKAQAVAETVRLRWVERLTLLVAAVSGVGALIWQVVS